METTLKTHRTRKALLLLPLFFIPILAFAFWTLHQTSASQSPAQSQGLNTNLPGAKFDKHAKPGDKMSFYDQAKQDSARAKSNNNNPLLKELGFNKDKLVTNDLSTPASRSPLTSSYTDPTVTRINQKLAAINKQISQPQPTDYNAINPATASRPAQDKATAAQIAKLELMMKSMNASQGSDPQMQQLTKMLAQIQEIQHPELAKPTIKNPQPNADSAFKAIPATIDGNQKVLQGGIVKLLLNDTIRIKGKLLPKGQLLFGNANITNQRLLLEIKNIRIGNAIIPVSLSVYSPDGLLGINAPDAEIAGAAGDGANNAMESMQFLAMDQNLATQAAAGGISAAKGLFSKKVRRVKVKLKGGSPVLLKINRS
jgi:hypothetical protein